MCMLGHTLRHLSVIILGFTSRATTYCTRAERQKGNQRCHDKNVSSKIRWGSIIVGGSVASSQGVTIEL